MTTTINNASFFIRVEYILEKRFCKGKFATSEFLDTGDCGGGNVTELHSVVAQL